MLIPHHATTCPYHRRPLSNTCRHGVSGAPLHSHADPVASLMQTAYPVRLTARFGQDDWDLMEGCTGELPLAAQAEQVRQNHQELTGTALTPTRPVPAPKPKPAGATVKPLAQSNSVSCGQTSVAMSVNALTGKRLTDGDIDRKYGFGLLSALNGESRGSGYSWRDGGNFSAKNWPALEKRLNKERTPVLIGLSGPTFSPSGRGHIVTLLSIDGEKVRYADPADGKVKTTTRRAIEQAPPHPDGKFFFYASKGKV